MSKVIHTEKAPAALGPYSQAIEANGMLFVSGQIPFVPETMTLVSDDVKAQIFALLEHPAHSAVNLLSLLDLQHSFPIGRVGKDDRPLVLNLEPVDPLAGGFHPACHPSLIGVLLAQGHCLWVDVITKSAELPIPADAGVCLLALGVPYLL